MHVITPEEFNAHHRPRRVEWLIFTVAAALLVLVPYCQYRCAKNSLRSVLKTGKQA